MMSASHPSRLTLRAHAKINLDLRVSGPWPDGFHDVTTVLQSVGLYDTLTLARSHGPFTIRCSAAGVPVDERNLIWVGARALWRRLGRHGDPNGVDVLLRKRIAMEAGRGNLRCRDRLTGTLSAMGRGSRWRSAAGRGS